MNKKKQTSLQTALQFLQEHAAHVFTQTMHPNIAAKRSSTSIPYNVISFTDVIEHLYSKGYILDRNTVSKSRVRKDEEKPWAAFQIGFYNSKIVEPYGMPHYIIIRARENGSRRVVVESCFDYGRKGRGCIMAFERGKYDHREHTTENIIIGIDLMIKNAKADVGNSFEYKAMNLSPKDISTIIQRYNREIKEVHGATPLKRTDVMLSLASLPNDGFVRRRDMVTTKIHADLLWAHGSKHNLYNLLLACNRLLINRRLGNKTNPMVCSEDAAWQAMLAAGRAAISFSDERYQRIAFVDAQYHEDINSKLAEFDKLDSYSPQELVEKLIAAPPRSLEEALLYKTIINRANEPIFGYSKLYERLQTKKS